MPQLMSFQLTPVPVDPTFPYLTYELPCGSDGIIQPLSIMYNCAYMQTIAKWYFLHHKCKNRYVYLDNQMNILLLIDKIPFNQLMFLTVDLSSKVPQDLLQIKNLHWFHACLYFVILYMLSFIYVVVVSSTLYHSGCLMCRSGRSDICLASLLGSSLDRFVFHIQINDRYDPGW